MTRSLILTLAFFGATVVTTSRFALAESQTPPQTPANPSASPSSEADSNFNGEFEELFQILIGRWRELKDKHSLDKLVGDPFRLRPDTEIGLRAIPYKIKLNLGNVLTTNIEDLLAMPRTSYHYSQMERYSLGEPELLVSMALSEELGQQAFEALIKSFSRALTYDQLVDLGFFGLSKLPFFPSTDEGWEQWKENITAYDLYVGLAVLAYMVAMDKGKIGFAGRLYKTDTVRFGWFAKAEDLGIDLSNRSEQGGLKLRTAQSEAELGIKHSVDNDEHLALKLNFKENWFSSRLRPIINWDTQGGVGIKHVLSHEDDAKEGITTGELRFYGTRQKPFKFEGTALSVQGTFAVNSKVERSGGLDVALGDTNNNLVGVLGLNYGADENSATYEKQWKAGFLLGGKVDRRHDQKADFHGIGRSVLNDLEAVKAAKENLANTDSLANTPDSTQSDPLPEKKELAKRDLGIARLILRHHVVQYLAMAPRFEKKPMDKTILTDAINEAQDETFGVERYYGSIMLW